MSQRVKNKIALIGVLFSFIIVLLSILYTNQYPLCFDHWGLIKVLPISYIIAIIIFAIFNLYIILNSKSIFINILCLSLLIIIIFGTATLVEGTPRFIFTFKASTNIDYILRYGELSTDWLSLGDNSRFQLWPAVYLLSVMLILTSTVDINTVLLATPVLSQLLYLLPLLVIFSKSYCEEKYIFIASGFFFLMNWANQEFLSNQVMGFFFILMTISSLFLFIFNKKNRSIFSTLFLVFFLCVVISHGLSSMAMLLYTLTFVTLLIVMSFIFKFSIQKETIPIGILKYQQLAILTILVIILFITWSLYQIKVEMLTTGITGLRSFSLFNFLTNYESAIQLADRGSADHLLIGKIKVYYALLLSFIAMLGWFYYVYKIRTSLLKIDIQFIFFTLVIFINVLLYMMNLYGGEAIIRAYLFSLLSLVYFSTKLLGGRSVFVFIIIFFYIIAAPMHIFIHYTNENENYTPPAYLSSNDFIYQNAVRNSVIFGDSIVDGRRYYDQFIFRSFKKSDDINKNAFIIKRNNDHYTAQYWDDFEVISENSMNSINNIFDNSVNVYYRM